ncbi:ComEA family DNA-binding protein [Piscinibacter sakaiensis]|uniref:ComEA family DNA-binding protein n=1 Tax=Piscinibacter sakaiensis TaxID=1547922 RepID=UPI003AAF55B9
MFKHCLATLLAALTSLFAAAAFAAVDINKADQAALESIKGIGPAMSTRLLDERKKSPFKDWPDMIDRVKGLGTGNAGKLSEAGLTVNGTAYAKSDAAKPAAPKAADNKPAKK